MTLRERRIASGLLQTEVAESLEVVQTAVSKWETGDNAPLEKYQRKLAQLYGCSLDEIKASVTETATERAERARLKEVE